MNQDYKYDYRDSGQQGRVGRMVLQQDIVSVDFCNQLTWGALQFLGVYTRTQPIHCSWMFTFGPSLVTVSQDDKGWGRVQEGAEKNYLIYEQALM